jgi:hypothetical protein
MRAGIPNPKTRERRITLFLDKKDFRTALELTDEAYIFILVVDQQRQVHLRLRGLFSRDAESSPRETLLQLS